MGELAKGEEDRLLLWLTTLGREVKLTSLPTEYSPGRLGSPFFRPLERLVLLVLCDVEELRDFSEVDALALNGEL